jgi:hypothetical protein
VILLSVVSYAVATVYGRVLAIAVLPSLRRTGVATAGETLVVVDAETVDVSEPQR